MNERDIQKNIGGNSNQPKRERDRYMQREVLILDVN